MSFLQNWLWKCPWEILNVLAKHFVIVEMSILKHRLEIVKLCTEGPDYEFCSETLIKKHFLALFSSPEPNQGWSTCKLAFLIEICPLTVIVVVNIVIVNVVNFSRFHVLRQNHETISNKLGIKALIWLKGIQVNSTEGLCSSPREDSSNKLKYIDSF